MKESLVIRSFGPIKEIELDNIRPLTILIGESGSGKSTILKVLALFRWIYKMVNLRSYLKYSGVKKSPFRFTFGTYIKNNGFEDYLNSDSEIIYTNGSCVIKFQNGYLETGDLVNADELSLEKISFISDKRNLIPDFSNSAKESKTQNFFLQETFDDYNTATKQVRELDLPFLDIRFVAKKGQSKDIFFVHGLSDQYIIKLKDSSSGTQTVTPLCVIAEYFSRHYDLVKAFNNAVFSFMKDSDNLSEFKAVKDIGAIKHRRVNIHIEEPELSLYPEAQRDLLNYLVERCIISSHNGYNMTLMLATHSPYIVNQVNLLIKANQKNTFIDGANIGINDVDVFEIRDGYLISLKQVNEFVIDTRPLSDPISDIYTKYNELND